MGTEPSGLQKVPPPLNPNDPLNQYAFSLGPQQDNFRTLPGINGIPHRSSGIRYYKNDDPAHLQPQAAGQVRCEMFNMSVPEEKLAYQVVCTRVHSMSRQGKATMTAIERNFDATTGAMLIYLEWIEEFTYDPVGPSSYSNYAPDSLRRS